MNSELSGMYTRPYKSSEFRAAQNVHKENQKFTSPVNIQQKVPAIYLWQMAHEINLNKLIPNFLSISLFGFGVNDTDSCEMHPFSLKA